MKTKIGLLLIVALLSYGIACDITGGDFTPDGNEILKIVEDDKEGLYGVNPTNDADSLYPYLTKENIQKTLADGFRYGRKVNKFELIKPIDITVFNDSIRIANISYRLTGVFGVDSAGVPLFGKPMAHLLSRSITFVKRKNPRTNESWTPIAYSPAYGSSLNPTTLAEQSNLLMDTLWVKLGSRTFTITDPADLTIFDNNRITLHNFDTVYVLAKIRNPVDPLDRPVGRLISGFGRNKDGVVLPRRFELVNFPVASAYYQRMFIIEPNQNRKFNQLVIDFVTQSSINRRLRPYDSYIVSIPYFISD